MKINQYKKVMSLLHFTSTTGSLEKRDRKLHKLIYQKHVKEQLRKHPDYEQTFQELASYDNGLLIPFDSPLLDKLPHNYIKYKNREKYTIGGNIQTYLIQFDNGQCLWSSWHTSSDLALLDSSNGMIVIPHTFFLCVPDLDEYITDLLRIDERLEEMTASDSHVHRKVYYMDISDFYICLPQELIEQYDL